MGTFSRAPIRSHDFAGRFQRVDRGVRVGGAALAALLLLWPSAADAETPISFASNESWEAFATDPDAGGASLGPAQTVCLSAKSPANCPEGATIWRKIGSGWSADLSAIPGAHWIWAPGISNSTSPAERAEFFFRKEFSLPSSPTSATISVAVDDFVEVRVNGQIAGSHGSTTDVTAAMEGQSKLATFDIAAFLVAGENRIVIRAANGAFGGCVDCAYSQEQAGVVFGGTLETSQP